MMRHSRAARGFTLIEVMVALAIFAVAAIALTRAGISYSQGVASLNDRTQAHWVAMNEAARLRIEQTWPEGSGDRDVEEQGRKWRIHFQTYATPVAEVKRIELTIFRLNRQDQPEATPVHRLVMFLAQPRAEVTT